MTKRCSCGVFVKEPMVACYPCQIEGLKCRVAALTTKAQIDKENLEREMNRHIHVQEKKARDAFFELFMKTQYACNKLEKAVVLGVQLPIKELLECRDLLRDGLSETPDFDEVFDE